ncbi:MAG TPA: alpha-glucan family phosphorylase [Puia sp.]|jgi:starch phosphorylase|nr:alpha-glucan family phosphorylase [Puia sp.]
MSNSYGTPISNSDTMQLQGFESLRDLALDMRWSWNNEADMIWQQLDPILWEQTHNPWIVLQTVSSESLKRQLSDSTFRQKVDALIREKEAADAAVSWFTGAHPGTPLKTVAYFSMEFMLSEALPIYVGGLGNVAGDQLKSASDLGVPVIGIGLLYQQGYFRQEIDRNGEQRDYYPYNDPGQLPISPLRNGGDWLRLSIPFPGGDVWLRVWKVRVGRATLYLLDSNDAANHPLYRGITAEVYGGDNEMRIKQEIVLGIGGWRLLEMLDIHPEVCHLNEGHAAFAVLERARTYMERSGCSFEEALTITRAGNLFTSHTAVAAGFDHFDPMLIVRYLGDYATRQLHISIGDLLGLGRQYPHEPTEGFNMAYLAIHGSGAVNGVSELHGRVSRHLFGPLFWRWPTPEVPVGHVTNGVHVPSWESAAADGLWTAACGKDRWLGRTEDLAKDILTVPDDRIWQMRSAQREMLVTYIRHKLGEQLAAGSASPQAIEDAKSVFDAKTLTLGFGRRFVPYKRLDLLLLDPARLVRLLTDSQHPVQLVMAGKAPPSDQGGRNLIKRWIEFINQWNMSRHVIFLSDYDMLLAEHLVQGVDVWLNVPQRPWEASGTSGMKVLVNGGLNVSELDGWWVEAYRPEVGWALGDGKEHGDDPAWNAYEAELLFGILEQQVIPSFYHRDHRDIPVEWVARVRQSMATLTPFFSANRTVREYTEHYYLSAAKTYSDRAADNGALGRRIVLWKRSIELGWPRLRFGEVTAQTEKDPATGEAFHNFDVQLSLDDISAEMLLVELYADGVDGGAAVRRKLDLRSPATAGEGMTHYGGKVPADRPAGDYTARVMPYLPGAAVPLESARILWQR